MTFRDMLLDRAFNRKLLLITLPISMQNLMLALVAAADALMLGRFDQNAMAAVSLATQIQFIQNMLIWGIVGGISVMGAQYWGKKDIPVIEKIFGISIRLSSVVCIAFFIGCFCYPAKLMQLFASDEELIRIGVEYLKIAGWSYLLTGISQCYLGVMKISDHVTSAAVISSGAVVLNILLNAIFIFGKFGLEPMGVQGAALATVIARTTETVSCLVLSTGKSYIKLKPRYIISYNRLLSLDFLRYMLPILGSGILWGTGFTAYTAFIGHMGQDPAAANAIAAVIRDLMCCLCNGFAGAAGIMIGNELGSGHLKRGKLYGNRLFMISLLTGLFCTVVILLLIPVMSHYIPLTEKAHHYMIGMFAILSVYMIGRTICTVVINGIFSAGGDTIFDIYSLIVCMWGIALPCAFAGTFYFDWPVLVVYACTCLDEVGKLPWVLAHHLRYKWVRNITR